MRLRDAALPISGMILGLGVGVFGFRNFHIHIPPDYAPYLSLAALAALDTVFGGLRAGLEGRFQNDIFASGFVLNTLLASTLAWVGDGLGINLGLVAVLVLGSRLFNNLSLMRRFYLNKRALLKKQQEEEAVQTLQTSSPV